MPEAIKLGSVMTYGEGLPPMKSYSRTYFILFILIFFYTTGRFKKQTPKL